MSARRPIDTNTLDRRIGSDDLPKSGWHDVGGEITMERETRLVLTIAVMVCVLVALIALDVVGSGGETLARVGVGQYGRHGSSF